MLYIPLYKINLSLYSKKTYIRDEIKDTLLHNYKFHRAHKKYYDKSRLNQFLLCVNAIQFSDNSSLHEINNIIIKYLSDLINPIPLLNLK